MIKIFSTIIFIFCVFNLRIPSCTAESVVNLDKNDRILILAPHPDDEAIGAAGLILQTMSRHPVLWLKAKVRLSAI